MWPMFGHYGRGRTQAREGDDCDEWASSGWRSDAAQTRHMEYLHQPRLERDWSHTMSIIIRLLLSIERLTFWNLKSNCILVMLTRFNTLLKFAMIRGGKRFRDYCIHYTCERFSVSWAFDRKESCYSFGSLQVRKSFLTVQQRKFIPTLDETLEQ